MRFVRRNSIHIPVPFFWYGKVYDISRDEFLTCWYLRMLVFFRKHFNWRDCAPGRLVLYKFPVRHLKYL